MCIAILTTTHPTYRFIILNNRDVSPVYLHATHSLLYLNKAKRTYRNFSVAQLPR